QRNGGYPFAAVLTVVGRAESLAQHRHMHANAAFLDHYALPDRGEQLVLADEFAGSTHETQQQVEGAGSEAHALPRPFEPALILEKEESAEPPADRCRPRIDRILGMCLHLEGRPRLAAAAACPTAAGIVDTPLNKA